MQILKRSFWPGIVSGIILGMFFKAVESMTGLRVYTLLMNVDYFPVLKEMQLPEIVEFSFHLIVSVALSFCFLLLCGKRKWSARTLLSFVVVVSFIIGILLYPTTALSERTPALTDVSALVVWLAGHGIYGIVLGVLLAKRISNTS